MGLRLMGAAAMWSALGRLGFCLGVVLMSANTLLTRSQHMLNDAWTSYSSTAFFQASSKNPGSTLGRLVFMRLKHGRGLVLP